MTGPVTSGNVPTPLKQGVKANPKPVKPLKTGTVRTPRGK